jgi:hypothetical protein
MEVRGVARTRTNRIQAGIDESQRVVAVGTDCWLTSAR